jgi:hypothetical protein
MDKPPDHSVSSIESEKMIPPGELKLPRTKVSLYFRKSDKLHSHIPYLKLFLNEVLRLIERRLDMEARG